MKRIFMLLIVMLFGMELFGCKEEEGQMGKFYNLQEAYEQKLLSKDDLENIAYYYNRLDNNEFQPRPKNPPYINKNDERIIKKVYLKEIINEPAKSIEEVNIYDYYGTYNECIVIGITDSYNVYDYVIKEEYVLDGISFYNFHEAAIRVFIFNK